MGEKATVRRKTNIFNYGVKGWLLIFYCCLGWMFVSGGWWNGTAGNIMNGQMALQILGDTNNTGPILAMNSYIGYVSVVVILFVGVLFGRFKTRIMQSILMFIGGIAICFYGAVQSMLTYFIVFLLIDIMANATSSVGLPQIIMQWFPTKKGSALGWATIGTNLAALVTFSIFSALIASQGVVVTNIIFGAATIVMGLINLIFIKNDPTQAGFQPDNGDFTPEELEAHKKMMTGPMVWTNKEAMKDKNFWLIGIAYGALFMCSTGLLQQLVPYQIAMNGPIIAAQMAAAQGVEVGTVMGAGMGAAAAKASALMKWLPAFAVPGSIFSGWLDQKIGTRRTAIIMAICYAIACFCAGGLFNLIPYNDVMNYIFVFLFFFWTGANANLGMSHAVSVFGPRDYPHVWGRLAFIVNLLRVTAALVLSWGITNFAVVTPGGVNNGPGFRAGYSVFFILCIIAIVCLIISDNRVDKLPGEKPTARYKS